jgi:hypothetical protein
MSRENLPLLSKEAAIRIELIRARHEKVIRKAMHVWHAEGTKSDEFPVPLTCDRQAHLRDLIVETYVHLGEAEAGEYAAVVPSPQQFEIEIQHLIETVAEEARERWKRLTARFRPTAWHQNGCAEPASYIPTRVRKELDAVVDQLVYDAWTACEERLSINSGIVAPANGASAAAEKDSPRVSSGTPDQHRRKHLAERLTQAKLDRGLSIGRLSLESGVDKKTLLGILHCRRNATPITLRRLADALGIPAGELAA